LSAQTSNVVIERHHAPITISSSKMKVCEVLHEQIAGIYF